MRISGSIVGNAEKTASRSFRCLPSSYTLDLYKWAMGLTAAAPPPVFHEEFLVVLEPVRRPDDGVVQTVSVEVLEGLANPLLEICSRDDLQIFLQR